MERTQIPDFPDKRFLTAGEISRLLQVPAYTLRYWESRLGAPRPSRRPSGRRLYSREDAETICRIRDLVYGRKLTLAGARKALLERKKRGGRERQPELFASEAGERAGTPEAAIKILRGVREDIKDLVAELSAAGV